jgi:hypothetical protein
MTTKQELKERMRLYEMYSTAALTGLLTGDYDWQVDSLADHVDKFTRAMIKLNIDYSDRLDNSLEKFK